MLLLLPEGAEAFRPLDTINEIVALALEMQGQIVQGIDASRRVPPLLRLANEPFLHGVVLDVFLAT